MPLVRRWSAVAAGVLAITLAACQDQAVAPTAPTAPRLLPSAELLDGAHGSGGNPHFYFLQPLATPPSTFTGTFDPTQKPTVEICEWNGSACVGPDVASFSMTSGSGAGLVRVDTTNQLYFVAWRTRNAGLDASKIYRIRVSIDGYELGHADVDPVRTGRELQSVDRSQYYGLIIGRTLQIKFRIEEGAMAVDVVAPIGAGFNETCALSRAGQAYCWGSNSAGGLGTGSVTYSDGVPTPQAVVGGLTFTSIAEGEDLACGLTAEGAAYCWGSNSVGALGTGAKGGVQPSPQAVTGGHVFTTIAVSGNSVCALTADGTAYCWGFDYDGQLGIGGSDISVATPTAIPNLKFSQIAMGRGHACGITTDGKTYCWGNNEYGQLGNGYAYSALGTGQQSYRTPQPVSNAPTFVRISANLWVTCALTADGTAYCWGSTIFGGLGRATSGNAAPTPAPVENAPKFTRITVGFGSACGLTADGTAYCWGNDMYGELGNGTVMTDSPWGTSTPTAIAGLTFSVLDAGYEHVCGILTDGTARCWGENEFGELGTGTITDAAPYGIATPTTVAGGITFGTP